LPESFDALHRLGIGVDSLNTACARDVSALHQYSCVILPATTAFDDAQATAALRVWVQNGGVLIITPFTSYMDQDGIFRGDGFAANLKPLTGTLVRTVRWMGSPSENGAAEQKVVWSERALGEASPVGLDGYVEYLEVEPHVEIIATFKSDQQILNERPAVTRNRIGTGTVIKLGFWPANDSFLRLLHSLVPNTGSFLGTPIPQGVLAAPRSDGSLFVINTTRNEQRVELRSDRADRISGKTIPVSMALKPYQVIWIE